MTNPDYTAILLIVDRSGSMQMIQADAEGAIASFVADQAKVPGKCTIRLVDFDTEYRVVYPSTPVADVPPYTLTPRGMTALLDAVGKGITEFGEELTALPDDQRPGKVIVVVQTDGEENSSREWTNDQVKSLIKQQEEGYAWTFLYLGANQDAISVGGRMGFNPGQSMTYDVHATRGATFAASNLVTRTRTGAGPATYTSDERAAAMGSTSA